MIAVTTVYSIHEINSLKEKDILNVRPSLKCIWGNYKYITEQQK